MVVSAEELMAAVCRELNACRPVKVTATGGSMAPFLRAGDCVVLARKESYDTDDIVLAMTDHGVMLHAVMPDGRLMGTANLRQRECVVNVAGCVVSVERGGRVWHTDSWCWRAGMKLWRWALPMRRVLIRCVR